MAINNTAFAGTPENANQGVMVSRMVNDFSSMSQVEFLFTADNSTAAALSYIFLLPGAGMNATVALPTGVTLTGGDYDAWAKWIDYTTKVPCLIKEIFMQTASTGNYANRIYTGTTMPNGKAPNETYKQLSNYKVSTGNGYAEEILIKDLQIVAIPNQYVKVPILKNTTIRVVLTVPALVLSADVTEAQY